MRFQCPCSLPLVLLMFCFFVEGAAGWVYLGSRVALQGAMATTWDCLQGVLVRLRALRLISCGLSRKETFLLRWRKGKRCRCGGCSSGRVLSAGPPSLEGAFPSPESLLAGSSSGPHMEKGTNACLGLSDTGTLSRNISLRARSIGLEGSHMWGRSGFPACSEGEPS